KIIRTIDSRFFGMNLTMWDRALGNRASESLLRAMNVQILRLPGGSRSDDYHWHTSRSSSDNIHWTNNSALFAKIIETLRAQAIVTVNYGDGTPEEAAAWVAW